MIASGSPPSKDSAVHVPDKVDSVFGDASQNLLASDIAALVDLDKVHIHQQSVQSPFQVPLLVLSLPKIPVLNIVK